MGILLAIHVVVTILLISIILIQKNEGGSSLFASSASSSGGMFNARGQSNILTKTTWILASIFLANCVLMAYMASSSIKNANTVVEKHTTNSSTENNDQKKQESE